MFDVCHGDDGDGLGGDALRGDGDECGDGGGDHDVCRGGGVDRGDDVCRGNGGECGGGSVSVV